MKFYTVKFYTARFEIWKLLVLIAFVCGLGASSLVADQAIPSVTKPVTDLSGILGGSQNASLSQKIEAIQNQTGAEVAILILPTTEPETIEQYSIRVGEQWKHGRKGVNDGLLIVIATQDRTARIEAGQGLEGAIPDAIAKRIIDEVMAPEFKAGNYFDGLDQSLDQIAKLIQGEALPPPSRRFHSSSNSSSNSSGLFSILFALPFMLRGMFGRYAGSLLGGIAAGLGIGFFFGMFAGLIAGAVAMLLLAITGGSGPYSSYRSGGWGVGSPWLGGSSSWGSGSGGSFGGSGGTFSGGGASGKW